MKVVVDVLDSSSLIVLMGSENVKLHLNCTGADGFGVEKKKLFSFSFCFAASIIQTLPTKSQNCRHKAVLVATKRYTCAAKTCTLSRQVSVLRELLAVTPCSDRRDARWRSAINMQKSPCAG